MGYIKVPKVYQKLKKAEDCFFPVIIMAPTGWGKSAAVEYFYRRKSVLTLFCRRGKIQDRPAAEEIRQSVVIIEDAQWLLEDEDYTFVRKLLREGGRQILILTRGAFPKQLSGEEQDYNFVRIVESDFVFGENEVRQFFADREVEIREEDIPKVTEASQGYPRALYYYTNHMAGGIRYSEDVLQAVWEDIYHLWDGMMYEQWSDEFRDFALAMCRYDEFSEQMAVMLTGNPELPKVLEYCRKVMTQIVHLPNGNYRFRPEVCGFFQWKRNLSWSKESIDENYRKGAYFYEMQGDVPNALKFYRLAGAKENVRELLIKNAHNHPGVGHFIETKDYYFELPEDDIKKSPVLMAGMSMIHDLILQPEQSENWYQELLRFENDKLSSREEKREAKVWSAYLDLALPHRGSKGILRMMKQVFCLIKNGEIVLPEMSVTGNMPTIMNGGLDFCEWSKSDTQIARFMEKPIETIVGKYAKGLVTIALAESGFEKGKMEPYEVMTRTLSGYEAALHGGKIEMCFVSVGIQARQHIVKGQLPSAKRISESFHKLAVEQEAVQLFKNMEAFEVWISLYTDAGEQVQKYIENESDVQGTFTILDRYRYMVRIRCLIAGDRLFEAFDLANFLTAYFESYERRIYWMENELLKGIILFRLGDEHWREHIKKAVEKAAEYHFVRLVSLEGAAVLPLLQKLRDEGEFASVPGEYLTQTIEETEKVACIYPDYMKYTEKEDIKLTKREMQILSLLCGGYSTGEICEKLNITMNGLKKHNHNLYKKLGVANRAEAERKAGKLGLVY